MFKRGCVLFPLIIGAICGILLFSGTPATSAIYTQQELMSTDWRSLDTFIWQDFEYWHAPSNYGWKSSCPPYPVYGWCPYTGFGRIETIMCPFLQSRVLFYSCMMSPLNQFYPFFAWNENVTYPDGSPINDKSLFSFDIMIPFVGIEHWDTWEMAIMVISRNGNQVLLIYRPEGMCETGPVFRDGIPGDIFTGMYDPPGFLFQIGREFNQGRWSHIIRDLDRDVDLTDDGERNNSDGFGPHPSTGDTGNSMVAMVKFQHPLLRVDNIAFHKRGVVPYDEYQPYLYKIGPRYAQIFEPYRYLFFADYDTGDEEISNVLDFLLTDRFEDIFITDPNAIEDYWISLGADPNRFGTEADPNISDLIGRDFIVDVNLPIFANPNYRLGSNPHLEFIPGTSFNQTLGWNATVGGIGASGVQFNGINPLEINPYDGMPTYIPAYYDAEEVIARFGRPFFGPLPSFYLECALWNAGFTYWPNIARLDFTPQYFEDIILSIEVTDGRVSDLETFPISVVNYPVENHPPYLEDLDDQIFYVGQLNTYAVGIVDADCMIFSLSNLPATTHVPGFPLTDQFRRDMDNIFWSFTLGGLPSYQYGPWLESMIEPCSGLIRFTPKFEGSYRARLVATDDRGASAIGEFMLFSINKGTWLNHPPVIMMDWDHPQVVRAGEPLLLSSPTLRVEDPDGDEIYFSSNIGSTGTLPSGDLYWHFYTHFPGFYQVEIIAFDIRGGYAVVTIDLEVKPWWSF
ncbi:MAG: hypothetical protein ACMUIL_00340 [bacterium]